MKTWGIIGALFFVAAVTIGYFCKFDGAVIVEIGAQRSDFVALLLAQSRAEKPKT